MPGWLFASLRGYRTGWLGNLLSIPVWCASCGSSAGSARPIVAIARLSDRRAQEATRRTGLIDAIGADRVFLSVEEAVRTLCPGA
jgi:hypothetical protein